MMASNLEEGRLRQQAAEAAEATVRAMMTSAIGALEGVVGGGAGAGAGADGASSSNQPQGSQAPPLTRDAIPPPGAASTPRTPSPKRPRQSPSQCTPPAPFGVRGADPGIWGGKPSPG